MTLTHALRAIPEFGDRVLRVIYNRTKHPPHIVTAFFDRSMKGKLWKSNTTRLLTHYMFD